MEKKDRLPLAIAILDTLKFETYNALSDAEKSSYKLGIKQCINLLSKTIESGVVAEFSLEAMQVLLNMANMIDKNDQSEVD